MCGLRMLGEHNVKQKGLLSVNRNSREHSRRLSEVSDRLLTLKWRINPVAATALGVHDYDCTLGEVSPEALSGIARELNSCRRVLQSEIDPTLLDADDYTDYQLAMSLASFGILRLECLRESERDPAFYPRRAMWGVHVLIAGEFAPPGERARLIVSRLLEVPGMLEEARRNLNDASRLHTEIAIDAVSAGARFLRSAVPSLAERTPAVENEMRAATETCLDALDAYGAWLQGTLLPRAQLHFPIGADLYEQIIFSDHLLTYSPDHILRIGRGVVINTLEELEEVSRQMGAAASWQESIERLKLECPSPDELLPAYQQAVGEAREFTATAGLVTFPERECLEVLMTPEFERGTIPHAAYMPPPPFESGSRNGHFWITPAETDGGSEDRERLLQSHSRYSIPVTALHESYPGHHLQFSIGNAVHRLMRKQSMSHIFAEGWGLYCEELMYEQGFYDDPRVRLFQLRGTLYHACQVLIDVGLHTGAMTFDEGVRMLVDTVRFDEPGAISEVRRYAAHPTHAMTNTIGKLLILSIREEQKRRQGSAFELRAFHDQMLSYGTIPTSLIAERFARDPVSRKPHEQSQAA